MKKKLLLAILTVFIISNVAFAAPAINKEELTNTVKNALIQTAASQINPEYLLQLDSLMDNNNPLIKDLKESIAAVKDGYTNLENKDTLGLIQNLLVLKENEESLKQVWDSLELEKLLDKLPA